MICQKTLKDVIIIRGLLINSHQWAQPMGRGGSLSPIWIVVKEIWSLEEDMKVGEGGYFLISAWCNPKRSKRSGGSGGFTQLKFYLWEAVRPLISQKRRFWVGWYKITSSSKLDLTFIIKVFFSDAQ